MGRLCSIPFFLLLGILAGLRSLAFASSAEPNPWLEIHSTHYTVITDAGEKRGKEVALRFEQMRAIFGSLLLRERLSEPVPLTILAFKSDKSYYQCAPPHQGQPIRDAGFILPGEDQNFIVLNLFEPEPWRAVSHDFALMLLNSNYPPVPGWFDEGVAQYFSSIGLDDRKYEIGSDPELQTQTAADFTQPRDNLRSRAKSFTELLSGQVWLALPDLLTMKHVPIYGENDRHTLFYAQSWMTVHYLIHQQKLSETGTYFGLVENQHVPVEEAIQKAYGVTAAQFDQAVKDYFHSLTPLFVAADDAKRGAAQTNSTQIYDFPEPVGPNDIATTSRTFTEADAHAITAEIESRIPDRREAGLKELQQLASTADPNAGKSFFSKPKKEKEDEGEAPLVTAVGNEIAHRALAWDHLQRGEFDTALEELGDAAALNSRDLWVRYYLSVSKYRMAQAKRADIQGLPNMLQDLRAVVEWYPEFADAYDLMAVARMEGGGPVAAMQAERAAIQLSPRNQEYVYHLAEIYESDKKWEAARNLLQHLESGGNARIASQARERLGELSTNQKYGVAQAGATSTKQLASQPSPFDILEQDAAKRAATDKTQSTTADRRPAKFLKGELLDVDCSQSPAAVLTVASGGTVLKLRTADYKSLLLIGANSFSCAWNNRSVSVNYKPGGMSDGDLLSVEVR